MKAWQANSILDTLEDYLEVPTIPEDLNEMADKIFEKDVDRVFYEVEIIESDGEYAYTIDLHFTDYIMEAIDVRDRWVKRGCQVFVTKITHERVNL
ncbi:MAG: hypothetical protein ACPG45_10525 [Flavobacteriaceae bacterium]